MLPKTTIFWLLRQARRKRRGVVAQDTQSSSEQSLNSEKHEADTRPSGDTLVDRPIPTQTPAYDDASTHGERETESQWRQVDYHKQKREVNIRDREQDTQIEADADSPKTHNRTSRTDPVLGFVTRSERPKSPRDTTSDHNFGSVDFPNPAIYPTKRARELWTARFQRVPNWFKQQIEHVSRRRVARRFKKYRLMEEQMNELLRPTVPENPPTLSLPIPPPTMERDFDMFSDPVEIAQRDRIIREQRPQERKVGTPIYDFFLQQRG